MAGFVVRRLLQMVAVLLGATLVLFCCLFLLGNPVETLSGSDHVRDPAVVKTLTQRYGLDRPLLVQYGNYLGHLVRGDLGESYRLRRPVNDVLMPRVGNTVRLAALAIAIDAVLGLGAGILAAVKRYSPADVTVTVLTTLAIGLPTFVIGLVLQYAFGVRLKWLPVAGLRDGWQSYVLPAVTLALVDAAFVARLMRTTLLEVLRADFIRTAVAKGLSRRRVLTRHAVRTSLIPVVTYLGISFGTLLGGALVTEVVFGLNGVGNALLTAIQTGDNAVVQGVVVYAVVVFVLVNLAVDVTYALLDPRIRVR